MKSTMPIIIRFTIHLELYPSTECCCAWLSAGRVPGGAKSKMNVRHGYITGGKRKAYLAQTGGIAGL